MKVRMQLGNMQPVYGTLHTRYRRLVQGKADLMERYGMWMMETAAELSPFDTGFMASHVQYTPLQAGWFDWEVGWYRKDFDVEGLPPYYFYQEFGTIYHPAQPSLGPAWRALSPALERDARALVAGMGRP